MWDYIDEISLMKIFIYSDILSIKQLSIVNKKFYKIYNNEIVWKNKLNIDYDIKRKKTTWKKMYIDRTNILNIIETDKILKNLKKIIIHNDEENIKEYITDIIIINMQNIQIIKRHIEVDTLNIYYNNIYSKTILGELTNIYDDMNFNTNKPKIIKIKNKIKHIIWEIYSGIVYRGYDVNKEIYREYRIITPIVDIMSMEKINEEERWKFVKLLIDNNLDLKKNRINTYIGHVNNYLELYIKRNSLINLDKRIL